MAAWHHPETTVVALSGTSRTRWYPLQAGLLGVGLLVFAGVMYLGAAPGGAALRPLPPLSTTDAEQATARLLPSPSAQRHLVLVVSDPEVGSALQRRIQSGELVYGEFGAYAPPLVVEVVVLDSDLAVDSLTEGLREFEAQCVAESCRAIQVLDLRTARLPE